MFKDRYIIKKMIKLIYEKEILYCFYYTTMFIWSIK